MLKYIPSCLFQIRPFLEKQEAGFRLKEEDDSLMKPIVFGVTSPNGINCRVETEVWDKRYKDEPINPDNQPSVYVDELRNSRHWGNVRNLQATILTYSSGILAHDDIRVIRQSKVSVLYRTFAFNSGLKQGCWVNIKSDGSNVEIS